MLSLFKIDLKNKNTQLIAINVIRVIIFFLCVIITLIFIYRELLKRKAIFRNNCTIFFITSYKTNNITGKYDAIKFSYISNKIKRDSLKENFLRRIIVIENVDLKEANGRKI